nr:RidA family protein [Clostridium sporogenes]
MRKCLFVSGQAPLVNGEPAYTGKVGEERTLEEAQNAAKICTINMLAAVKEYLGDLDRVVNVVKVQALLIVKWIYQATYCCKCSFSAIV